MLVLGEIHRRLAWLLPGALNWHNSLGNTRVLRQGESLAAHFIGRNPARLVGISPVMICSSTRQRPGASRDGQEYQKK